MRFLRLKLRHKARNVYAGLVSQHVLGTDEDVFQACGRHNPEPHVAIDAAKGQVVNVAAKGRNVGAFARIEFHSEYVLSIPIQMGCQLKAERSVAAFVFAKFCTVDPNGRSSHGAVEINEDMAPVRIWWQFEVPAIDRDEL